MTQKQDLKQNIANLSDTLAHLASELIQEKYIVNSTKAEYIVPDDLLEDYISELEYFRFSKAPERWGQLESEIGKETISYLLIIEEIIESNPEFLEEYEHSTLNELVYQNQIWSKIREIAKKALRSHEFDLKAWEKKNA